MSELGMEKRPLRFSLPEAFFEGSRFFVIKAKGVGEEVRGRLSGPNLFFLLIERGRVPQKALRSGAGMVPLGLPRGEWSEDRERIFLAGKNLRLSEGLTRAHLSLLLR